MLDFEWYNSAAMYEQDPAKRRDELIEKHPFAKTFLNTGELFKSINLWSRALEVSSKPLREDLKQRVGENWEYGITGSLHAVIEAMDIFDDEVSQRASMGALQSLFFLGYEIGDTENIILISENIAEKLRSLSLFRKHVQEEEHDRIARSIGGLIYAGVFVRRKLDQKDSQDIPEAFKDFLDGLEL